MFVNRELATALALALLVSLGTACGGEEATNEMPVVTLGGGGGGGASARPAARPAQTSETTTTETTGRSVVVEITFEDSSRDPFEREFPEGELPLLTNPTVALTPAEPLDLGPLAEYPLESLRLQAIITRTPEPRAMFLVPDGSGLAVLARIGDRVGPNATGQIIDIRPNGVEVSYEGLLEFGAVGETQVRTQVVTLRDPARDIEAEFEPY